MIGLPIYNIEHDIEIVSAVIWTGSMTRAPDLTPTEVIDRVRAARKAEQQAAVEELELALEWARLHPCPANETPAHWGEADLHDEGWSRWPAPVHRGLRSSPPSTWPPPSGSPTTPAGS